MKILVFSDLHAHPFAQYARILPDGRNSRLQDALDALAQIRRTARAEGIRLVLFGGDLFHVPGRVDVAALNGVHAELVEFGREGIELFLLVGNHDQAARGEEHALEVFKSLPHVTVLDRPGWVRPSGAPGLAVYAIPYTSDVAQIRQLLGSVPDTGPADHRLLLLHAGFDGAEVGPHEYRMAAELKPIDIPDDFDWVLSGHYHIGQQVDFHGRIRHIGATTPQDWGDANQERGFLILDLAAGEIQHVTTPAPRFLRLAPHALEGVRPNDIVEVILPHDAEPTAVEAVRATLDRRGVVHHTVKQETPPAMPRLRSPEAAALDIVALVRPYVEAEAPDGADLDTFVSAGLSYLRAAGA